MKIKFNHKKNNIMESLDVSKSRIDKIMTEAQEHMKANNPDGKKSEFLEAALKAADTDNEKIATAIVWYASVSQMETIAKLKAAAKGSNPRIIKPNSRIIRPN